MWRITKVDRYRMNANISFIVEHKDHVIVEELTEHRVLNRRKKGDSSLPNLLLGCLTGVIADEINLERCHCLWVSWHPG